MTSRVFAPKAGERNQLFSRDPTLTDSAKWTTRDKDLTLSDDPTFQYDRKMELEKEDRTRGIKDPVKKQLAMEFYDRCIPQDKPLYDELHINFLDKYHDRKHQGIEAKSGAVGKRLGAPLSTEEQGILPQNEFDPKIE